MYSLQINLFFSHEVQKLTIKEKETNEGFRNGFVYSLALFKPAIIFNS